VPVAPRQDLLSSDHQVNMISWSKLTKSCINGIKSTEDRYTTYNYYNKKICSCQSEKLNISIKKFTGCSTNGIYQPAKDGNARLLLLSFSSIQNLAPQWMQIWSILPSSWRLILIYCCSSKRLMPVLCWFFASCSDGTVFLCLISFYVDQ
jgi:hypothetical protein